MQAVDSKRKGMMVELDIDRLVRTVMNGVIVKSFNSPEGIDDMDFKDDIYKQSDLMKKVIGARHGNCDYEYPENGTWQINDQNFEYYTIIRTGQLKPLDAFQFYCSECGKETQEIITDTSRRSK